MTKKEAIKKLKDILEEATETDDSVCYVTSDDADALNMAIKALEQEPCEDAISRQAVDTLVDELARAISDERCYMSRGRDTSTIIRDIRHLPPVKPQVICPSHGIDCEDCPAYNPKTTGHWIWELEDWNKWTCSECGFSKRTDIHVKLDDKFCPNCGARMSESEDK